MKQTSNKTANKTKRTIAAFLAAVTVLTAFAGCSGKDEESSSSSQNSTVSSDSNSSSSSSFSQTENLSTTNDDEFKYYLSDDEQSYEISRYKGEDAAIYNIPSEHDGLEVTAISSECYGGDNMVEVNIPDTVNKIGFRAFRFCTKLEKVNMGNGVEIIEDNAFLNCEKLSELTLSDSLKEIQYAAFSYCTALKKVTIPDGVTKIEEIAFGGCTNLEEVHIPASVTEMVGNEGNSTFEDCDKLTIYAPAGSYAEQYAKDNDIPFVAE